MSKPIPTIEKYMTASPHSIGVEQTLARAQAMMQEHKSSSVSSPIVMRTSSSR